MDGVDTSITNNTNSIEAILNNYGSKNISPINAISQTINGIAFTVNSDGSVKAVGTSSSITIFDLSGGFYLQPGEYIISDGGYSISFLGDVHTQVVDYTSGEYIATTMSGESRFTINATQKVRLEIATKARIALNGTFYPMIRDARVTDDTYIPYVKTNKQLTDDTELIVNEYGVKNLLSNNAVTQTINTLPIVINSDKSIYCHGTNNGSMIVFKIAEFKLKQGTYILSDGGYSTQFSGYVFLQLSEISNTQPMIAYTANGDSTFTIDSTKENWTLKVELVISSQYTLDGTFYPMIRDARIIDNTYSQYAMTNRELTERIIIERKTGQTSSTGVFAVTKLLNGYFLSSVTLVSPTGGYFCTFSIYTDSSYAVFPLGYTQNGTFEFLKNTNIEIICTWIKE